MTMRFMAKLNSFGENCATRNQNTYQLWSRYAYQPNVHRCGNRIACHDFIRCINRKSSTSFLFRARKTLRI